MIKTAFNNQKYIYSILLIFSAAALLYSSVISGCGGGGGSSTPAGNSFTPKSLEVSGSVEGAALSSVSSLNTNSLRAPAPINFASECEIKAFDINGAPIYGANGYFAGGNFFLSMPLTEDYGRYLLVVIRLKTGHELYKRLLGRIPRYDDAPYSSISVSNLKLNEETTAKALVLLEDASKLPAVEIASASIRTRFEIESEALINDADSTRIISPLKTAIATVIKVMKVDKASINTAKTNYLSGVATLLNSYVTIAKARETDADIKSVITETPQINLNGKIISSASGAADINVAVESIKETIKPAGVETPLFSPAGGSVFERPQSIVITCATGGAIIKYALYGNTPNDNYGIIYSGPINIKESTVIKAVAIKSGLKNSAVAEAAYTILNTSVSPLILDGISIGSQNGPIDYIYKNGAQSLKNYDITRPFFEIEFKREDGNDFTLNQTPLLRLKLSVTKIKNGVVSTVNYSYGSLPGSAENDFSEDFGAPLISGRHIKFNYKSNPARPVEDASYELKIKDIQNVSYTNSSGLLSPNYYVTQNISGSFNIYTAGQTLVSNPVFSPAGGSYNDEIYMSLSCATAGASIRYTLDSSTPSNTNGTIFNNIPILISSSTVVKAIAYKTAMRDSEVIQASYLINKTAAPQVDPPPGVYAGARQITITSKTPGASIYYTLDGSSNPSRTSALYVGPIIVSASLLIKAIAVKDGMKDSNITSGEYIINKTEPPQFNPPAGTYAGAQNITLFTSTPGASIHYTLDGSAPGRFSPSYSGPVALSAYGTTEIKAIAYKTDMADSAVAGAVYLILERTAAPQFNPAAGVYDSARSVTITSATPGASIYYTLDGSAPNRFSTLYSTPVEIKTSLKLRAVALKDGMADSSVSDAAYTINTPQVAKPVIYPSTGTYGGVQHVTITTATPGASIYYTLDESVPSTSSTPYSGTIEVSQTSYIKAIAVKAAMLDSQINESYITINMPRPQVEDPQFSPAPGTHTGSQQLTLSCSTAGASIYYTLDGSRPTTSKTRYSTPFAINANSTVKAIAVKQPDLSDSNVVTAEYLIKVPAPLFSVAGGTYSEEKTVAITSGVTGASIYYTTNGATPTADQQYLYSGPVAVGRSMTLKAIAVKSGMLFSSVTQAQYVIKVKTPEFNPAPGNYTDTQSVTITCQTPNSSIYFTLDGTPPTAAGTLYTAPITVSANTTIKAIGVKSGLENSDIASGVYTVQPKAAKPFMTPPGGVYNSARSVTIATLTSGAVIKYTTNGTIPTTSSATYSSPITVSATSEVKAIAIKSLMLDSDIASESYIIDTNLMQAAAPSFNPPAGSYNEPQAVTISSATAGASIYYTLDGTYPSVNSLKYLTPVTINSSAAVRAIAVKSGMAQSSDSSAAYVIKAAAPVFNPPAGTYDAPQSVAISSTTAGSIIRYTTDGSNPSLVNGHTYSAPLTVSENSSLRAIAIKTGMANSDISQAAYSIRAAAPVMSLETGSYEGDQSVAITTATNGASIRYTIDGSEPSSTAGTLYSTPVSVTATTTLRAIAYKNNMLDSAVTTKTYTLKTAAPVFSPAAGTYEGPKPVAITCATGGAIIYYTTDGSTPTTSSAQYSAQFNIDSSQTIKAFAQKTGLAASNITTAAYVISVPAPAFNPAPGTYQNSQAVTLTCAMSGASIHYTTDASTPTAASAQYSSAITVSTTTTIKAIAIKAGAQNSSVATGLYTIGIPAAAPVFNPPAGAYTGAQSVAITSSTGGASIYYTTNGSEPTTASTLYSAPITISTTTTLKAIAVKAGMLNSTVSSAAYTITIAQTAAPVFSPAAGTYTSAQTVAITSATSGASIYYTTNGSEPTTASTLYNAPITVSTTTTLKAIAVKAGMNNSTVTTAVYTINAAQQAAAPVFNPAGGTYSTNQNVSITSSTAGAGIHYTLDNSTPSASSIKYSSPIPVAASVTIKAIAVKAGMTDSAVSTAEYNIAGNTFSLTTTAFTKGGAIPAKYSGFGTDVSPPFSWANAPAETKSFALVCSDDVNNTPDNPQDDFIHWVIYNIPPTATGLAENITKTTSVSSGVLPSGTAAQGKNSFGNIGYNGPAPPSGVHTYNFAIIALDQTPTLPPGLELMAFVMAINGKLISQTIYSGTYQAP